MAFRFLRQEIPDVILVESEGFRDDRGAFYETYRTETFAEQGMPAFVQDNFSRSKKGVVRGLHFQNSPHAVAKLVRCVRGKIFDVAVDIRRGSPTFARWLGVELSDQGMQMLFIPPGFAHGFCALTELAEVSYRQSDYYTPALDRAVRWNDPAIGIAWPVAQPILSTKDAAAPLLKDSDNNAVYRGGQS
jgi:dTDP-4-dehydrorhamnose 3,5-epimerase